MRFAIALAVLVLLALGGEGHAQSAKAAAEAFEKGRTLMAAKKYEEACAAFELSLRLDPQYGTQFNLAGCYDALNKLATAWKLYRELARGDTNLQRRARSAELAQKLAKRVPQLRIRVDQQFEGLKVIVGGTDVTALLGADIPFDPGHYVVEATLPNYRPFREEIDVEAGSRAREIEVVLEPLQRSLPRPRLEERPPSRRAGYGKLAVAGGGALVAFGLVAGWRALASRDASRELCNATACPDRPGAVALTDRARLWGNLSTVSVILGAVGVGGGLYLWSTSRPRSGSVQAGAAVAPGSASLVVSGAF
jgi:tetratricopeptide (TPR) repeat protein